MANPNNHLYSNHVSTTQTHLVGSGCPDMYTNLVNSMDMIGFHSSRNNLWKSGVQSYEGGEYVGDDHEHDDNDDESSLRACVYSSGGDHVGPTQALSLSLSSSSHHPLQPFGHDHDHGRYVMTSSSSSSKIPSFNGGTTTHQDEVFMGRTMSTSSNMSMQFEMMSSSKYLLPSQDLLNEFVSLGTSKEKSFDGDGHERNKMKKMKSKVGSDHNNDVLLVANDVVNHEDNGVIESGVNASYGCSSRTNVLNNNHNDNNNNNNNLLLLSSSQSLYGLNLLELQKRKTKLLAMLEELDRRYKRYCEQLKGVVSSFEAIAGSGSADVYTSLASKVMSRHFRCLRDAIVAQIKATKKAIGDKDVANSVPGTTKGETPRLRMLDQAFRQQRALQQMTIIENHPWRPQRGLPERSVSVLRAWLFEHFLHPYPSDVDKHILARQTGLSRSQVSNWFINARVRLWKPMVEQMYQEESKDLDDDNNNNHQDQSNFSHDHQPCLTPSQNSLLDQKPTPNQLLMRIEPETLSSIVHTPTTSSKPQQQHHNTMHDSQYGRNNIESFGSIEDLDFTTPSYGAQAQARPHQSHVSLTLGLQQHGGNNNGVSLASFSPTSHQGSFFYNGRDDHNIVEEAAVHHHHHHQYSLMDDGDPTAQNSPYRNLMGAQLLHDFAS